jgi:hypothetical protein
LVNIMVRARGLEPPRNYPPDPKSGASASSATPAFIKGTLNIIHLCYHYFNHNKLLEMQ